MHSVILETIAAHMRPEVYVELGIAVCGTLNKVTPHAGEVYAVDAGVSCADNIIDKAKVKFFGEYTTRFAERWRNDINKPIDLIFIDADHSADSVRTDVYNFLPFLKPSTGLMVLHDTWPPTEYHTNKDNCGDCYKIKEWLRKHGGIDYNDKLEITTIPTQYGMTLIRKIGTDWREGR